MRHILIAVLLTVLVVWRRKAIRDGSDSVQALTYGLWVGAVITVIDISGSLMGFWQ